MLFSLLLARNDAVCEVSLDRQSRAALPAWAEEVFAQAAPVFAPEDQSSSWCQKKIVVVNANITITIRMSVNCLFEYIMYCIRRAVYRRTFLTRGSVCSDAPQQRYYRNAVLGKQQCATSDIPANVISKFELLFVSRKVGRNYFASLTRLNLGFFPHFFHYVCGDIPC